jgi:hypothetical protein
MKENLGVSMLKGIKDHEITIKSYMSMILTNDDINFNHWNVMKVVINYFYIYEFALS